MEWRFWNRALHDFSPAARSPQSEFPSSVVIHRAVFAVCYPKQGTKYGVIGQVEIQMTYNNNNNNNNEV